MKTIPNELSMKFDTTQGRKELMRLYGNSDMPYSGVNSDGETVHITISPDEIILHTYQSNGWCRVNYYDENGNPSGETFDGRWK